MRDRAEEIRALGAELAIVGNGAPNFAAAFREDFDLSGPLLVDPELRAYRAAGLRRGRVELLSPRLPLNALRALWGGSRQTGVQGDPWQLGGVFVIGADGETRFAYSSSEAGDHPDVDDVIAALAADAPLAPAEEPSSTALRWLGRGLSLLVDPTILLSFDRTGFGIHSLTFDPGDLDRDLSGKRCLVTGANSGIGFESALALADLGARVVLLCRNLERGNDAAERIRQQTGNVNVSVVQVDMSSPRSVRRAAKELASAPVDVLIHNAGVLPDERSVNEDGMESTLATHVVGPWLLTDLLLPALEKAENGRVIWVSSGGMYTRRLNMSDPNWEKRDYDGVLAYAETKRAQVILAELWAEKLRGTRVKVNAMHPGWADTPSVRSSIPSFYRITRAILRTPAEGADTVVWLAASEAAGERSGEFFFDRQARRTHFLPTTRESKVEREQLWELCERASRAD